jgi:hypothetical protein
MGGWFYPTSSGSQPFLLSKDDTASNRSYGMSISDSDTVQGRISTDGTTQFAATCDLASTILNKWGCYILRFTPSSELLMRVIIAGSDVSGTNTTSVPASIFNGTAPFNIGARNNGTNPMTGRAAFCFICATALQDGVIDNLVANSRGIFGV